MSELKLYKSSAGSGKTTVLSREYIKTALLKNFKRILAVTFTNKATFELKERVIRRLYEYSQGTFDHQCDWIMEETQLDEESFKKECSRVLHQLLNNYGYFSIQTIDSFFQSVIRSFARDLGLQGNFTLELDADEILNETVDRLMNEAGSDPLLSTWLLEYAEQEAEEGRQIQLKNKIIKLAERFLQEDFKEIKASLNQSFSPEKRSSFFQELTEIIEKYRSGLRELGGNALRIMESHSLEYTDFAYGLSGVAKVFYQLNNGQDYDLSGSRVQNALKDPDAWSSKKNPKKGIIIEAVNAGLMDVLEAYVDFTHREGVFKNTAEAILNNYYTFGITTELLQNIQQVKKDKEVVLLSDSNEFLKEIIKDNDTPFIYEKVGNSFAHFFIDEFQDTSRFQWNNFFPLIQNSLSEGNANILVGDVKQSIYRWRGGDLSLINREVKHQISTTREEKLETNYRSSKQVIEFNNHYFEHAIPFFRSKFSERLPYPYNQEEYPDYSQQIGDTYADVLQKVPHEVKDENGYIELAFVDDTEGAFNDESLTGMVDFLERLQLGGVHPGDMAILTRTSKESRIVLEYLMKYVADGKGVKGVSYEVISDEALKLNSSPLIHLIVECMKWMNNKGDNLAFYSWFTEYLFYTRKDHDWGNWLNEISKQFLDPSWEKLDMLRSFSGAGLREIASGIVEILELQKWESQWPFLHAFNDYVIKFLSERPGDLSAFLSHWEKKGYKAKLDSPSTSGSMRLMTIHKSKGLEFSAVMIPFCNWGIEDGAKSRPKSIFWAEPSHDAFRAFPYYPLNYSRKLVSTHFRESFLKERTAQWIDNINLQYVAFTRAEEFLYIGMPGSEKACAQTIAESLFQQYYQGEPLVQLGQLQEAAMYEKGEEMNESVINHSQFMVSNWRKKIRLSHREMIKINPSVYEKIEKGEVLHAIFSEDGVFDGEEQEILDRYIREKVLLPEEQPHVSALIAKIKSHPLFAMWNTNKVAEYNEQALLTPKGEIRRPDKVIETADQLWIIDFKSGEEKPSHYTQVREYMSILLELEKKKVEGILIYLQPFRMVRIKNDSIL